MKKAEAAASRKVFQETLSSSPLAVNAMIGLWCPRMKSGFRLDKISILATRGIHRLHPLAGRRDPYAAFQSKKKRGSPAACGTAPY
jgi:hypothetical protein